MALWIKMMLWAAVVLLPGGLVLLPVVLAEPLRKLRDRARALPAKSEDALADLASAPVSNAPQG